MMPEYWRDLPYLLQGMADCCNKCGYLNYPHRYVCVRCGQATTQELEDLPYEGKVYSYVINYLTAPEFERPNISVIVDMGERKIHGMMTDCLEEKLHVGMSVERVIRVIKKDNGFSYYGIKFRPKED